MIVRERERERKQNKRKETMKMKKSTQTIGILSILIIAMMMIGCIAPESKPRPVVRHTDCEKTLSGLNWVVRQQVIVRNMGDSGEVSVEGSFGRFSETSTVYLREGESRTVHFEHDCTYQDHGRCTARAYVRR